MRDSTTCYNTLLSDDGNRNEEGIRVSPTRGRGRTKLVNNNNNSNNNKSHNLKEQQRSKRRCQVAEEMDDFENATQFLNHFHAIASRSLDVIYEINDFDDTEGCDDDEYYFKVSREFNPSSAMGGTPGMRRTQTCACLLDAQRALTMNVMRAQENQDGDWGFYCEAITR